MKINIRGMYFCGDDLYNLIREIGGEWNDTKERPIVFFVESLEYSDIYWAIPVGNYKHRNDAVKNRIHKFMALPDDDLRSCYYHIGKTTVKTIFFISDVIPVTEKYIEREYLGYDNRLYIIKNKELLKTLERKLNRILAFEKSRPNYFRQHITDMVNVLSNELLNEKKTEKELVTS